MNRGFSLIELLVTIGIVGLLLALTSVAVQRARDVAGSVVCQNKLRQIGLATSQHHAANREFHTYFRPPMTWENYPHMRLLPFLEEKPYYDFVMANRAVESGPAPPNVFLCESDVVELAFTNDANYVASFGLGLTQTKQFPNPIGLGGYLKEDVLRLRRVRSESDIVDGLSNTIFYGERLRLSRGPGSDSRRDGPRIFEPVSSPIELMLLCKKRASEPNVIFFASSADPWLFGGFFTGYTPPNSPICEVYGRDQPWFLTRQGYYPSSSQHSNRCNFLFGDGSVRSISDTVEVSVFRNQNTVAGDEAEGN